MEQLLQAIALYLQLESVTFDSWEVAKDSTVIINYVSVNKYGVRNIRSRHSQNIHPRKFSPCEKIKVDGNNMTLLTREAKPTLYQVNFAPIDVVISDLDVLQPVDNDMPMRRGE